MICDYVEGEKKSVGKFKIDEIYCGDALELMKDIPNETIDLIVTDPPFAIDFKAKRSNYNRTQERVIEGYNCLLYTSPSPRDRG